MKKVIVILMVIALSLQVFAKDNNKNDYSDFGYRNFDKIDAFYKVKYTNRVFNTIDKFKKKHRASQSYQRLP